MKIINYAFSLLFLTIITLPLILLDTKSTVSKSENRTLAIFPDVIDHEKLNTKAIKKFPVLLDEYLNDRIGFKNEAVAFINNINVKIIGKFTQGDVIFGEDKWLFYSNPDDGNNILDFLKINLFSEDEIRHFITNIENRLEWCNANNIKFIFLIAPNKHNIYPEYYPIERPDGITRTEQIMNVLPEDIRDVVIYPRDYLISKKVNSDLELYYKTDTHWNMLGAYYVSELIYKKMQSMFPNSVFSVINYSEKFITDSVFTDLPRMLGMVSQYKDRAIFIEPEYGWESHYKYIKPIGLTNHDFLIGWVGFVGNDGMVIENVDKELPKAIIFRDSFFSALEPFTSTMFSSAEYNWRWFSENEKEYILQNKPDIIIWEVVERSIGGIPNATW